MGQRKPKPVGEPVKHSLSGVSVQIYLQPDMTFSATLNSETFSDKTFEDLQTRVYEQLSALYGAALQWHPAILVKLTRPWMNEAADDAFVGFDLGRFYYADRGDGEPVRAGWSECQPHYGPAVDPLALTAAETECLTLHSLRFREDSPFRPPCQTKDYSGRTTYYLPYQEEIYLALVALADRVRQLREHLNFIIGTPEGNVELLKLMQAAPALLPEFVGEQRS